MRIAEIGVAEKKLFDLNNKIRKKKILVFLAKNKIAE